MYERMLDKQKVPTCDEFVSYCGAASEALLELNEFLEKDRKAEKELRFPYGNSYGWGLKYFIKKKHICDVFAEKEAFTVMMRLTNQQFEACYNEVSQEARELIDHKYPCGGGGWIHYRILTEQNLSDVKRLLLEK